MATEITKIALADGTIADIRDASAQAKLDQMQELAASGMEYKGTTTTALLDGATVNPVTIDGNEVQVKNGWMVNYDGIMFAWNGTQWDKLGQSGEYGTLAYQDSAVMKDFQTEVRVPRTDLEGTKETFHVSITSDGKNTVTVTAPTTETADKANYQPSGTIGKYEFHGDETDVKVYGKPTGNVTITSKDDDTDDSNYQPSGTIDFVEKPTVDVDAITIKAVDDVGTVPTFSATVADEDLKLSWKSGTPVTTKDTEVANAGTKNLTINPRFTGTKVKFDAAFDGTENLEFSGKITPNGHNDAPEFTGDKVIIDAAYEGSPVTQDIDYTPQVAFPERTYTTEKTDITVAADESTQA